MVSCAHHIHRKGFQASGLSAQRCNGNHLQYWGLHGILVLVDNGSAADILIAKAFIQMGFEEKDLRPSTSPLCGFGGRTIDAMGKAILTVCFGQGQNTRAEDIVFDIVDIGYPYNAIIGRATLNAFEVVLHSSYLAMKIPTKFEVITIFGS